MSTTENGHHRSGLFLTLEGLDGSGKTTQARLLADRFRKEGRQVVETTEPGGTALGDAIRALLLGAPASHFSPTAELMLFFAARAQNVDKVIVPALQSGKVVVCDRFTDSSVAYQGAGRGLGENVVLELERIVCRGLTPDLTLVLDLDPEVSLRRAAGRILEEGRFRDRMHQEELGFHRRVRETYLRLARREPRRFRVIDAAPGIPAVAARVWEAVTSELASRSASV